MPRLARSVTRIPGVRSGDLIMRDGPLRLDVIVSTLAAGQGQGLEEVDEVYAVVAEAWTVLREEGHEPEEVRWKILALADWAWLTNYLLVRLDDWVGELPEPPNVLALPDVVRSVVGTVAGDERSMTPDQASEIKMGDWVLWGESLPIWPDPPDSGEEFEASLGQVVEITPDRFFPDIIDLFWLTTDGDLSPLFVPPMYVSEKVASPDQLEPFLHAPRAETRELAWRAHEDLTDQQS